MTKSNPRLTVLMPVFNGEPFLQIAIESIINQTFADFEFLIIDDGSTDNSVNIIKSYNDPRIRLVQNVTNMKLPKTLNRGIEQAQGEYIARMDCDDISMTDRLELQVAYLDAHPDVGLLGGHSINIDSKGNFISKPARPQSHICNLWVLLFKPALMHPSVMFRKQIVQNCGGYSEDMLHSQDYDLWSRMSNVTKIHQLPDVLVKLRKHDNNIGYTCRREQLERSMGICEKNLHRLMEHSGGIRNSGDVARFVRGESSSKTSDVEVYLSLIKIFATFMQKYEISKNDKAWIADRFISLFWPYFGLQSRNKLEIFFKVMREPSISLGSKIYIANIFAIRLLHICKKRLIENKVRVLTDK